MSLPRDQFAGKVANYEILVNQILDTVTPKEADWGIDTTIVQPGQKLLDTWQPLRDVVKNKTKANTDDRNNEKAARKLLTAWMRKFVKVWIYENALMNDGAITSTGMRLHKTDGTKVGKPDTEPNMTYKPGGTHVTKAYYKQAPDAKGVSQRGKPPGVGYVEVAYYIIANPIPAVGTTPAIIDVPPPNVEDFPKRKSGRRSPISILFDGKYAGQNVAFAARFVTETLIPGDWGAVQYLVVT